jgi:AcrR family transcriptional regulator
MPIQLSKGQQTRAAILVSALELASREGLEGLTIGALAERLQMSKSGVFSHFGSREDLQIAVLHSYERHFLESILFTAVKFPRGIARLQALLGNWLSVTASQSAEGCLWISGASEYDGRPGPVRDALVSMVRSWQGEIAKAIEQTIAHGHLRTDTDIEQLIFEVHGVILVLHHDGKLLANPQSLARAQLVLEKILLRSLSDSGREQFSSAVLPAFSSSPSTPITLN